MTDSSTLKMTGVVVIHESDGRPYLLDNAVFPNKTEAALAAARAGLENFHLNAASIVVPFQFILSPSLTPTAPTIAPAVIEKPPELPAPEPITEPAAKPKKTKPKKAKAAKVKKEPKEPKKPKEPQEKKSQAGRAKKSRGRRLAEKIVAALDAAGVVFPGGAENLAIHRTSAEAKRKTDSDGEDLSWFLVAKSGSLAACLPKAPHMTGPCDIGGREPAYDLLAADVDIVVTFERFVILLSGKKRS